MRFVELAPFIAFKATHWTDEVLRALQNHLLKNPNVGDVIRGGSGFRKLRWAASVRGKRGGARVIYPESGSCHLMRAGLAGAKAAMVG